jgi:hydrogenase nickel incorporation protein HypA/HybF
LEHRAQTGTSDEIQAIHLEIGALSCVHPDSLRFSFALASDQTPAANAELVITIVPVVVFCDVCGRDYELESIQRFRCPRCDTPTAHIVRGKELDIVAIELKEKSCRSSASESNG